MKTVLIDLDGALGMMGEAGYRQRPYFEVLLQYCLKEKVRVYCVSKNAMDWERVWCAGFFTKDQPAPVTPNLVITSDADYAKRWNNSIVIPAYSTSFNEFASLSLAGRILDVIKDRVVLNKQVTEPVKQPEKSDEKKPPEDISRWGVVIR